MRVCLPQRWTVSLSLPPGSKEPPSSRSVIGQGSGVLDTARCWLLRDVFQQMVEVRECHHIAERIRGERLSSRSCVVHASTQNPSTKVQTSLWVKRDPLKKHERKTQSGIWVLPLTRPALCSPAFQVLNFLNVLHCLFPAIFLPPLRLQHLCLLVFFYWL